MSRLLIVEDNSEFGEMLSAVLESHGHTVKSASNGLDAMRIVETWSADLIISDIHMPGLNGLELIRRIRLGRLSSKIPIIAVTGHPGPGLDLALKAGATAALSKPFEIESLLDQVNRLVGSELTQSNCSQSGFEVLATRQ